MAARVRVSAKEADFIWTTPWFNGGLAEGQQSARSSKTLYGRQCTALVSVMAPCHEWKHRGIWHGAP
ncbi:hypothetical protein D9M69_714780 [compost metagenome]